MNWYLKEIESEIETEAELEEKTFLINKVLDRLIHNVSNVLFYFCSELLSPLTTLLLFM